MPVHNSERYLRQALNSIVKQTFTNWQCLVVDDCSDDNSVSIIQEYTNSDKRFSILRTESNAGPAVARNLGIQQAVGRYLCFLDSDDFWYPEKLEQQLAFVKERHCAICYSAFHRVTEDGCLIRCQSTLATTNYQRTLYNNLLNTCSVMLDTTQLTDIQFPENIGHEDLGLWLKLLKQVPQAYGMNDPLLAYRIHSQSRNIDIRKRFRHQWQIYLQHEQYSFVYALWLFCRHSWVGFSKRGLEGIMRRTRQHQ